MQQRKPGACGAPTGSPHSRSPSQARQALPSQTCPLQSAVVQQVPFLHEPSQQTPLEPHWSMVVHGVQPWPTQWPPTPHSPSEQHSPLTQAPWQQTSPCGQSSLFAHGPHPPQEPHTSPGWQSAMLQQLLFRHSWLQHFSSEPQSSSWLQPVHLLARQFWPGKQSLREQHSAPATQLPSQQRALAGQLAAEVQAWHWLSRQMPALQSEALQQSPRRQVPLQHLDPTPHSPSCWQAWQV